MTGPKRVLVPVDPIRPLLARYHAGYRPGHHPGEHDPNSWAQLAARAGVSEKALYRIMHGQVRRMDVGNADRLAIALGHTLFNVWPHDDQEESA